MEAIKNGLRKNLTPAQLWSGARFFLLLNLGLIIYAVALNFYCAPNHFVFGGTTGLSIVLATCFPALSVSTFMWITNAVLDVLGCVFLGIKTMGWTLYSSFMLSFYSSMCEKMFPVSQPLTDDTLLELCFAVALPAIASGIVFNIGASTGGTEIVAMILHKYIKVEIGRALLLSDIGTVLFAAYLYGPQTGPVFSQTYGFAICSLMEMQWQSCAYIHSGEYFHGPFEVTEPGVFYFLQMGSSECRAMDERALAFLETHTDTLMVLDAMEYGMGDVPQNVRAFLDPILFYAMNCELRSARGKVFDHHPDVRRYMGIEKY